MARFIIAKMQSLVIVARMSRKGCAEKRFNVVEAQGRLKALNKFLACRRS